MTDFEFDDFTPDDRRQDDIEEDETSFIDDATDTEPMLPAVRQELLQTAVDDYYNTLSERGQTPTLGRDYTKFELVSGRLRLKAYPTIEIVNSRDGKPMALSTIARRRGGGNAVRDELGFDDWRRAPALAPQALAALRMANLELADPAGALELDELHAAAATTAVDKMETTFTDMDDPPLNIRELRGLDRTLRTMRGELTNNLAKLTQLDEHIHREKQKLNQAEDEFSRRRIAERLRDLEDERVARIEAVSANRKALRTQINRIRETISRMLNEDTTLAERLRTLFREQGITIASILTALGFIVSTLVLAFTGGGGGVPPVTPPTQNVKEWIKKHLESLGRALAKLAGKAAAALPGIIGSIVSWLLKFLAKTANWLAENMWALVVAAGGLLYVSFQKYVSTKQPKRD